jgi:hypothetical protein
MSYVKQAYKEVFDETGALKGKGSVAMPFFNSEQIQKANELRANNNGAILMQRVKDKIDVAFGLPMALPTISQPQSINFNVIRAVL